MAPGARVWDGAERVLVVRLDNVGDIAMLTPALRALRSALPEAEVTLMASPAGARMAPLLPWVDRVMVEEALWQALGPRVLRTRPGSTLWWGASPAAPSTWP